MTRTVYLLVYKLRIARRLGDLVAVILLEQRLRRELGR